MPGVPGTRAEGDSLSACSGLQRPERARVIRVGIAVGQVGRPLLFEEHTAPGQQLHQTADDLVQQRL